MTRSRKDDTLTLLAYSVSKWGADMPKDKTASHIQVIIAMRAEFLEKGFADASVRSIAARAGMSAAGLYRHYKNKEDMFDALMQPLMGEMNEWLEHHRRMKYAMVLQDGADREMLFGEAYMDFVKDVLYPRREEFKLLLRGARGTKYENFLHDFVEEQQRDMMETFEYMRAHGCEIKIPTQEEMHTLLSAYLTAVFETILHGYEKEKMEYCMDTLNRFFLPGWMAIMG